MATLAGMPVAASALLAIDTSTETMSVALRGPQGVQWHEAPGGAQASATLLPSIRALLHGQGLRAADLQAVAFGRGPGAFTGLRTACAVAQGLALGAGCPVVPVDSLMLVAEGTADPDEASRPGGPDTAPHPPARWRPPAVGACAAVAMDARMGEIYAAVFRWSGSAAASGWEVVQRAQLCLPEALVAPWQAALQPATGPGWVAGSGLALLGPGTVPAGVPLRTGCSRAAALLRLAERLLAAGEYVDPAQALPLYLRDKVALTVAERAAAAASPA